MGPEAAKRRLAAIMFNDVVGYTALMAEVRLRWVIPEEERAG